MNIRPGQPQSTWMMTMIMKIMMMVVMMMLITTRIIITKQFHQHKQTH